MREILFRGKQKYNGEWIISGNVFFGENRKYMYFPNPDNDPVENAFVCREVIPETVGQYTGLTVPSGNIFEHDIVTAKFKSNGARFNFTVKYSNEKGCYVFDNGCVKVSFNDIRSVRKIGNIHDNPELLF